MANKIKYIKFLGTKANKLFNHNLLLDMSPITYNIVISSASLIFMYMARKPKCFIRAVCDLEKDEQTLSKY